jgi:F0F1-type ATP synthase membrane subunit b/b'
VIEAEKAAHRVLDEARAEEARILAVAHEQAKERIAQIRRDAQAESESMIEAAERALSAEREERLARAGRIMERELHLDEKVLRSAATAVVRCVCGTLRG